MSSNSHVQASMIRAGNYYPSAYGGYNINLPQEIRQSHGIIFSANDPNLFGPSWQMTGESLPGVLSRNVGFDFGDKKRHRPPLIGVIGHVAAGTDEERLRQTEATIRDVLSPDVRIPKVVRLLVQRGEAPGSSLTRFFSMGPNRVIYFGVSSHDNEEAYGLQPSANTWRLHYLRYARQRPVTARLRAALSKYQQVHVSRKPHDLGY